MLIIHWLDLVTWHHLGIRGLEDIPRYNFIWENMTVGGLLALSVTQVN